MRNIVPSDLLTPESYRRRKFLFLPVDYDAAPAFGRKRFWWHPVHGIRVQLGEVHCAGGDETSWHWTTVGMDRFSIGAPIAMFI